MKDKQLAKKLLVSDVYGEFCLQNPGIKEKATEERNATILAWINKKYSNPGRGSGFGGETRNLGASANEAAAPLGETVERQKIAHEGSGSTKVQGLTKERLSNVNANLSPKSGAADMRFGGDLDAVQQHAVRQHLAQGNRGTTTPKDTDMSFVSGIM